MAERISQGIDPIQVCVPRLPNADALAPHLREIDEARRYTNSGPQLARLEAAIAAHFDLSEKGVAGVANGTLALLLALRAADAPAGTLCIVPAWTFAASAHAVVAAGLTPYFVDVDPGSWALTPELARRAMTTAPGEVGAVLPVSPFGAPIDYEGWLAFRRETGKAVVIDAAAAFDTARPNEVPVALSLHATKVLGVGEGGLVLSRDAALIARVKQLSNFGFNATREAKVAAINAKLSEYAAAVGLAALDSWPMLKVGYGWLARCYAAALGSMPGVSPMPRFGEGWATSTCVVQFDLPIADAIAARLADAAIETRHWWAQGCHRQAAFAACPRSTLDVTDHLATCTLGLPFHLGLGPAHLNHVMANLRSAIAEHSVSAKPRRAVG